MMLYRSGLFFITLFTVLHCTARAQTHAVNTKEKYTIPFRLTAYNYIVIKAALNHQDTVSLMLHTASGDVTLTEEGLAGLKTVKFNGTVDSVQSWGGHTNASDFSKNNTLTLAGISWDSVTIWKDKMSGQETNGKFGLNIFENKVLEIDFNSNLLTVETKLPRKIKKYEKLPLLSKNDELFVKAICQIGKDTAANEFLIHSGYAGAVLLDDQFAGDNKIGQQVNITSEKKLQDAYGHTLIVKKGTLPLFTIGTLQLENVPVGFFEGAIGSQKISVIGGDILKRFNWIIDAKREHVYLKPNKLFGVNFSDK